MNKCLKVSYSSEPEDDSVGEAQPTTENAVYATVQSTINTRTRPTRDVERPPLPLRDAITDHFRMNTIISKRFF